MGTNVPLYLSRSNFENCKCDAHDFEYSMIRYKQLADKKHQSGDKLMKISREKISPTSSTLDSISTDEVIKSVYKTDYGKRDTDSLTRQPIIPTTANWKDAYRDPFKFRYSAIETPTIQPDKTCLLKVSEIASFWDKPFTGSSEYVDKISKLGLSNMRNQQQYLKPLLPIKRKLGGCNL